MAETNTRALLKFPSVTSRAARNDRLWLRLFRRHAFTLPIVTDRIDVHTDKGTVACANLVVLATSNVPMVPIEMPTRKTNIRQRDFSEVRRCLFYRHSFLPAFDRHKKNKATTHSQYTLPLAYRSNHT